MPDLIVRDVSVVDGTGIPAHTGSVAISGDLISAVAAETNPRWDATRTIDGRGAVLSPGFVDVHNHSDLSMFVDPWMRSSLRQGVTTVIVGNCGSSAWPAAGAPELASMVGAPGLDLPWTRFGEYLDAVEGCAPAVNVASLVGHGAIRQQTMGVSRDDPDPRQLDAMKRLAADAMNDGAFGVSSGLIYVPGIYSRTREVAAVASAAADHGIYASHIRGEGKMLFDALAEAEQIGGEAAVPVHVSHLKCETSHVWGEASRALSFVHGARDMTADQYPYVAWNSSFASLLPPWAPVAGLGAIWSDSVARERLVHAVEHGEPDFQSSVDGVGWNAIVAVTGVPEDEAGSSVAAIAAERGLEPVEALVQIVLDDPEASCIGHAMSEPDVREILADREVMVASDASAMSVDGPLGSAPVHPREYGTFPRVLGHYVRDGVVTLEAAVRKMTSTPARRFGLDGRGVIEEGAIADLVLFEPDRIADTATFEKPHRYPEGIRAVIVAGKIAWDGSDGERAGRALRR